MSRFFIARPIFAWVIAIIIMLIGALSVSTLPIAQYPSIAPPSISISVTYPGASAETVQSTVVQVIEQQLSGLDHLLYFTSESDKDGSIAITLSFAQGTDPDIAQVQVQNKLTLATPLLPEAVQQQGIRVAKATKNFLMILGFVKQMEHPPRLLFQPYSLPTSAWWRTPLPPAHELPPTGLDRTSRLLANRARGQ